MRVKEENTKNKGQLNGQLILAGKGGKSQYIDFGISSTKPVSKYLLVNISEQGEYTAISSDNSEILIIDYRAGNVKGAFLAKDNGENKYFEPIKGLLCGIWCSEKKTTNQWFFLWCDLQKQNYKHAEFRTTGFDDETVLEVFSLVFTCLKKKLCDSVQEKIKEKFPELVISE